MIAAEQTAERCIDGDVVTLIIVVQQIMTGLRTPETEDHKFALIKE
jgi:hypothetical protein